MRVNNIFWLTHLWNLTKDGLQVPLYNYIIVYNFNYLFSQEQKVLLLKSSQKKSFSSKKWLNSPIQRLKKISSFRLDFNGTVFDYVNGHEDLLNKKVRFDGIPQNRIQEDYLRILRYFRFFSHVRASPHEHDGASIKAIRWILSPNRSRRQIRRCS